MNTQEEETCYDYHELLEKLNSEADNTIKHVEAIKKKGRQAVSRADAACSTRLKDHIDKQTKTVLSSLIQKLIDINCDIELDDDDSTNLFIPYISPGTNQTQLTFLMGDNPWNFWLQDDQVDTRSIHKLLLNKYQSGELKSYPNAKPSESVCFYDRNKVLRGIVLQTVNENRIKLQDCDSNALRVVSTSCVYKIDIDACLYHASVIKCTISKDSTDANLWTNDLRDLFWSVLKENILNVNILERLPGTIPSFVVQIDLKSEDNDLVGNLNSWIIERLMPEIKKLTAGEDSITDLLSSEVLDPYYTNQNVINQLNDNCTDLSKQQNRFSPLLDIAPVMQNDTSTTEQLYNHETEYKKKFEKDISFGGTCVLPEIESECTSDSGNSIINKQHTKESNDVMKTGTSDSGNSIINKQHTKESNDVMKTEVKEVDQFNESSRESQAGQSNISPSVTNNNQDKLSSKTHQRPFNPHPIHNNNTRLSNLVPHNHNFGPLMGQPLFQGAPGHPHWNNIYVPMVPPQWAAPNSNLPINNSNIPVSIPLPKEERTWSSGNNVQSSNIKYEDISKISNINNVNVTVNVMAPEFVPTKSSRSQNTEKSKYINEYRNSYSKPTPAIREVFHVELRKPSTLLNPGENLLVLIAHVETPFEFYVHFLSNNNKHIDNSRLIKEMFENYNLMEKMTFSSWSDARDILGRFCACKWLEDNHWYRAEVIDWNLGDNHVKVFFVDYGNTEVVPLSCLQPLQTQFAKLSMCAQPCHLAKIHPLDKTEVWSPESLQYFKSKVDGGNSRAYTITVVPSRESKIKINSLSVLLYEGKGTDDSISINDEMVENGFAWSKKVLQKSHSTDSELYHSMEETLSQFSDDFTSAKPNLSSQFSNEKYNSKSNVLVSPQLTDDTVITMSNNLPLPSVKNSNNIEVDEYFDTWDPQAEDYYSVRNNPLLNTDDACVAVSGYSAKDEARICKFYARQGLCRKSYCTKEHIMPNEDGTTTDKIETYMKSLSVIPLPPVGDVIDVRVTSVLEMSTFYVQLKETKAIDLVMDEDEETLSELISYMNEPKNIQTMRRHLVAPAVGELVLANAEGVWHRARIISSGDSDDIEVMFVDFGTISTVDEADIREMQPQYLNLPLQAIECSLANIIATQNPEDYERGSELLRDTIESHVLTAKVISRSGGDYYRSMQVIMENENGDIGELLVQNGYAILQD